MCEHTVNQVCIFSIQYTKSFTTFFVFIYILQYGVFYALILSLLFLFILCNVYGSQFAPIWLKISRTAMQIPLFSYCFVKMFQDDNSNTFVSSLAFGIFAYMPILVECWNSFQMQARINHYPSFIFAKDCYYICWLFVFSFIWFYRQVCVDSFHMDA